MVNKRTVNVANTNCRALVGRAAAADGRCVTIERFACGPAQSPAGSVTEDRLGNGVVTEGRLYFEVAA